MQIAVLFSVFVMGFMGSLHCAGMCGPISCSFRGGKQFFSYHVGRLISYLGVGSLLFHSSQYLLSTDSRPLKLTVSLAFGILFILFGLSQMNLLKINIFNSRIFKIQFGLMKKFRPVIDKFPILLGLLTGFFPCAWLYSFLLLAGQMKTYGMSMAVLAVFWMTSLPAFYLFTEIMQGLIKRSKYTYQQISGAILIFAGLFSVFGHWSDVLFLTL